MIRHIPDRGESGAPTWERARCTTRRHSGAVAPRRVAVLQRASRMRERGALPREERQFRRAAEDRGAWNGYGRIVVVRVLVINALW